MKKQLISFVATAGIIATVLVTVPVFAGGVTNTITATFGATKYVLNGIPLQAESLVYNDTAYFPAAYLAQQLGCSTTWDAATNTTTVVTGKSNNQPVATPAPIATTKPVTKIITATFGATKYVLDGVPLTEDSLVYNDMAYYPAAYLMQALDCTASWDAKTNVTTVTSNKRNIYAPDRVRSDTTYEFTLAFGIGGSQLPGYETVLGGVSNININI